MAVRKAEVEFVGDASSVVRASRQAAAAGDVVATAAQKAGKAIAEQASLAARAAAEQAQAAGASAKRQEAAYWAAADAATAAGIKQRAALEDTAAATEAAHAKMIASVKKSNEAFGKWGTATAAVVVGGSIDMALHVESAAAAIAKAAGTGTAAGEKIEDAFRSIPGTVEYSGAKIGEAFAGIAGELKTVEGHALSASQSMRVMSGALDLTDATGGDLKATTESLGKVMLTYGLHAGEAAKASDILFNASKATGETVQTFTTTLDKARGRLGALGPSVTETAALMAELAKQGVAGRLTMGALGGVFGTLVSKTKPVTATLKELNVHVFDSHGKFVGLKNVLEQLHPALAKYNQESQLQAARTLFGEKAAKQMLEVIHQGPAAFDAWTKKVGEQGTAEKAAAQEHKTMEGKLKATRADMENLSATIGEHLLPIFQKFVGALSNGIKWLDKHKAAAKALAIVVGTVLGAAVIDFAVVKVAKFVGGTKDMITAVGALAEKVKGTAGDVEAADGAIVAANEAAGSSFGKLANVAKSNLGKIVLAFAAAEASAHVFGKILSKITGENQAESIGELLGGTNEHTDEGEASLSALSAAGRSVTSLRHLGLSSQTAQGIVKALQAETNKNLEKGANEEGEEGAFGIAQWLGSRRAGLESFAKSRHKAASNLEIQLEYLDKELEGPEHATLAALKHANSINEAAGIFIKRFERPDDAAVVEQRAAQYGSAKLPSEELAAKHKKAHQEHGPSPATIDHWAEQAVGRFAESWGQNTGPELDKLQSEFHTHAAAWCAEFATTAAMMGGANKAVRTASVAMIRQWAEEGSHGYKKGVSNTPGVGSLMMFGDSHVGFVQSVDKQAGTDVVIEGNANGRGGVVRRTRKISEGDYATPIYQKVTTGKVMLERASKAYAEAVKKSEHLFLTAGEKLAVHRLTKAAASAHSQVEMWKDAASEAGEDLQAYQPRWALKRKPLGTGQGANEQKLDDEQEIQTAKAQKKYYEREVHALQKEVNAWSKLRTSYLRFARHQPPGSGAKTKALEKASKFEGKIKAAQAEAKALKGTIFSTETAIMEGEATLEALPAEAAEAAYQAVNSKIDLEERAGLLTPAQAKAAKEANANKALAGGYGALSDEGVLQVKGDLREFSKALEEGTTAVENHTNALLEATKALTEFTNAGNNIARVEAGSLAGSLADVISGQIAGVNYHGRAMTPGAGSAARY